MSVKVKDVLDALQQMQKSLECSICLELLKDPHSTKCNHQFCGQCIRQVLEKSSKKSKNKWYCPLCKTPVSKRSLTPNPKLSEIVAAVHSLQGAVQDDTGVPAGSPPSQNLKSPSADVSSSVVPFSVPQPTPQKHASGHRGRQKASKINHFTVYIDKNENSEHILESQPPQVVSNVNIRSSLRPLPVRQTLTKATKSAKTAKAETSRKTRHSKRIQEQKGFLEDNNVGRNSNEDLLHLIDTMTFKPVPTEGSSKDFILGPSTTKPKPDEKSTPSVNSSPSTITISTVKECTGEKDNCQNPLIQNKETVCLTTIAEADSSMRTIPRGSAGLFGTIKLRNCENTTNGKENVEAVSSSIITNSVPQDTSLDTMESVSILHSLDIQPHDSTGYVCNETQVEGNQNNEAISCKGGEANKLVADERCDLDEEIYHAAYGTACSENPNHDDENATFQGNEENKPISESVADPKPCENPRDVLPDGILVKRNVYNHSGEGNKQSVTGVCDLNFQEQSVETYDEGETHSKQITDHSDTTPSSEDVTNSIRDVAEQSLDFEGMVSLFDEPSCSNSHKVVHIEETVQNCNRLDKTAEQSQQVKTVNSETDLGQSLKAMQHVKTVSSISSFSKPKQKKMSPHSNIPDSENKNDSSNLCERVKQRQRRRTSKMPLTESPTTSITTESKAKKRSVDSETDIKTRDESSPEGSAKKKFKTSEVPSPSQLSSEKTNKVKKSLRDSGVSSKKKQADDYIATDCDEWSRSHQLEKVDYSGSSDKSIDSNEMIPASVSSSENSKSAVINPMDMYANQTSDERKQDLQKTKEGRIFIEGYSENSKRREGSSQDERENTYGPQVKDAANVDESTKGFTSCQKLSCLSQKSEAGTSGQSVSKELETGHLTESLPFDPSGKACFNVTDQNSELHEDDYIEGERRIAVQAHTSRNDGTHVHRKTLRTVQYSSGINSPKRNETGDTENDSQLRGKCFSQLAESRPKRSKLLSQEANSSSGTPTQCLLEVGDLTPCLFGDESCETPSKIVSQKRAKRVETLPQEVVEEKIAVINDADIKEVCALDNNEAPGVTELISGSRKVAPLNTDSEGTQSFGTSQSISVLHDLDAPSQKQQEGTAHSDEFGEPACHARHSNTETETDKAWAEPLPKKPKIKQHPESQGVDLSMSTCRDSKKSHGPELTESEIIPPTPPVKTVTKNVFGFHAQSPLNLSSSKRSVQRKDTCQKTCHSEVLNVKRKRSAKSPRCSNSPKLQDRKGDVAGMHCSSFGSEMSGVRVSVLENHDRNSVNAEIKGLSQAMESEIGANVSSGQQRVNLSRDTNTETVVHGSEINAHKTPKGLRRSAKIQGQKTFAENNSPEYLDGPSLSHSKTNRVESKWDNSGREDLQDSPSAEVESLHSSPSSPVKQRVANIGDSFDWSGTRTFQKGGGYSQDGPANRNNCENEGEYFRSKEVEDCDGDMLIFDTNGDSSESETERDLGNPAVGNIHVGNSSSVVDEESSLRDADEDDSSGDEALMKPVFLPKESSKSRESQVDCKEDTQETDDEEEVTVFSQELIPSENDDDDDDRASYKALDSTGASIATFLSEAAASTQGMEVLRQDVEAMEKEMEELRAYLAKTDENREEEGEEEHTIKNDGMNYQEAGIIDDGDIQPSLTPPPPLTPRSIPPMPQLSTPLKNVSRYLDQEWQSSDESSECEDTTSSEQVRRTELPRSFGYQGDYATDKHCPGEKSRKKRPLSLSYDEDGLSITTIERRQQETPSPPRSNHSVKRSQEKDEDKFVVIDDRDGPDSRTGSLLLVKRRKLAHDLVPKKSPVVSLLFTRAGKGLETTGQSPVTLSKESSPTTKKSSSFIYSRKPGSRISPIRKQSPSRTVSREHLSRDNLSRKSSLYDSVSRDNASHTSVSHSSASRDELSHERNHSPDLVLTNVKVTTKKNLDNERDERTTARQLSFVATRLNRQQLAEARALAEMYGGKLASEFNSKTSHVIMTTDANMQVTRHSYTMKYLLGLALGKWIVSHRWIAACNQAKSLVPEVDYEVKGDAGLGQASIPCVARTARSNKETLLFQDYDVLCLGEFSAAVTKEQLSQLLKFCGARVFTDTESMKRTEKDRRRVVAIDKETRDNAKELKAFCRHLNTKPVSLEWVTDSIANYKVQDLKDYVVEL